MVIQRFVKNRSTVDLALPVRPRGTTSTSKSKPVVRSFTLDAVAIVTDSRPSSLALTLVSAVSRENVFRNVRICTLSLIPIFSFERGERLYVSYYCTLYFRRCFKSVSSQIPLPFI